MSYPSSGEPMRTASDTSPRSSWRGSERSHQARQHYTVPTHLKTPDKLLFGLTARQLLLLLTGGSLAYALYLQWSDAAATWGLDPLWCQVLGLALVLPLVLLTLSTTFLQIADRPLEQWTIVFLHAHLAPRTYTWQGSKWEHDEAEEEFQADDDVAADLGGLLEEEEDATLLEEVVRAIVEAHERREPLSSTEGTLPKEEKQTQEEATRDPRMEPDSFQRSASSGQKRRERRQ